MAGFDVRYPLWDETAAAVMAFPGLVTERVEAWADVDMGFDGPDLGRLHLWGEGFAPGHARKVSYILEVDGEGFLERVRHAVLELPRVCG